MLGRQTLAVVALLISSAPALAEVDVEKLEQAVQQARTCITENVSAASEAEINNGDELFSFFQNRCLAQYVAADQDAGLDKEFAEQSFYLLVIQVVAPETWRDHLKELEQYLEGK
jgi:hypothetical protein